MAGLPFEFRMRAAEIAKITDPVRRAELEEINQRELEEFLAKPQAAVSGSLPRAKTFSFHGDGGFEVDPGDHASFGVVNIYSETVQFSANWGASMYSWTPGSDVNGNIWIAEDAGTTNPGTTFNENGELVTAAGCNDVFVSPGDTVQIHVVNYGSEGFHVDINVQLIETRLWFFSSPF